MKKNTSKKRKSAEKKLRRNTIIVKNAEGVADTTAQILVQNTIDYTPKVSVIIPVYNVEEYLRECLDSVVNQTLKEIEIICVDDGSTDSSLEILKEYADKDNRITVISQQNLHAGVARNAGLAVAKGEYLSFLDSDDFFELNMLEEGYNHAFENSTEVVVWGFHIYDEQRQKKISTSIPQIGKEEFSCLATDEQKSAIFMFTSPNPWTKLFMKEMIKQNNIYFEGTHVANDLTFVLTALSISSKICVIKKALAFYRTNQKSNITSNRGVKILDFIYAIERLKENLMKFNKYELFKDSFFRRVVGSASFELKHCFDDNLRKEMVLRLKELLPQNLIDEVLQLCLPKVSVIIPVYNVEPYLRQCLDSVLDQTLKDIEIICVNDGSTDNSLQILKEYAVKDKRIKIIDQKNQGPSCSRNNALKIATGKYIQFLDSDDYLRKDALLLLFNKAERTQADVVHFEGLAHYLDTNEIKEVPALTISYVSDCNHVYTEAEIKGFLLSVTISACLFFYRTSFIKENNLTFPAGLCFEDNYFVHKMFNKTTRYAILKEKLYYRTKHKEQITNNWDKLFGDYIKIVKLIIDFYLSGEVSDKKLKTHAIKNYSSALCWRYNSFSLHIKNKYLSQILDVLNDIPCDLRSKPTLEFLSKSKDAIGSYRVELETWYKRVTGKYLDLNNPKTFNEKIQWIKLYDSTPIKTKLADKYLVREWVKEKIGEKYLIPLLGVYDKFEEIDFSKLPNRFVIKCNHGCAYNIIVKEKSQLDLADVKARLDKWMGENYALKWGCELHYRDIPPKIVIEEFLDEISHNIYDYRFFCCNGKVEQIWLDVNSGTPQHERKIYDRHWNELNIIVKWPRLEADVPKPKNLDKLVELSEILSQEFAFVRVDFYNLQNKIYFGEMTFTSMSGIGKFQPEIENLKLGKKIKLPKLAYNIDTGEYYKLPKRSRIKPYLLFPYNLCKCAFLKRKAFKKGVSDVSRQLSDARLDIKNLGSAENQIEIKTTAQVDKPAWFVNKFGAGQVVQFSDLTQSLQIKVIRSGKLFISLKGRDKRFNGTRFPLWIDYSSIKIDGQEILSKPISVEHDKDFRYDMPVKDGQMVKVEVQQQYHQYQKNELQDLILKLNPNSDFIKNDIQKITDKVYRKIHIKPSIHARIKKWFYNHSAQKRHDELMSLLRQVKTDHAKNLQEIKKQCAILDEKVNKLKH